MSGIKHRTLVHIALNAKGERVRVLMCAAGRAISFPGEHDLNYERNAAPKSWFRGYSAEQSVKSWKCDCMRLFDACRFQRVMLVGGEA